MDYLFYQIKFWLCYCQICLAYSCLFWPLLVTLVCGAYYLGLRAGRRAIERRIRHLLREHQCPPKNVHYVNAARNKPRV